MNEYIGKTGLYRVFRVRQPDPGCVPAGSGCRGVDSESVVCVVVMDGLAVRAEARAAPDAARLDVVVCRGLK